METANQSAPERDPERNPERNPEHRERQKVLTRLRRISTGYGSLRQILCLVLSCAIVGAQTPQTPVAPGARADLSNQITQLRPNYVLRAGDQIQIRAFGLEEIGDRPYRINSEGFLDLPVLGRIQAAGVSIERLEAVLLEALGKYVIAPQVSVTMVQFSTELVFAVGAFKAPGFYPLAGGRNLLEMMESIGGLLPTASRRIKVTRRKEYGPIPLPNVVTLPDGSGTSVEINMAVLQNNVNPAEDIVLQPYDVIRVDPAQMIYVFGEVGKQGGLELQERDSISVIQALTLSGGLQPEADKKNTMILRPIMDTSRRAEIAINLPRILKGEDLDKPLLPNDVLVVGKSGRISARDLLIFIPIVTVAIALARIF